MLTGNLSAHTWAVSVSFGMVAGLFPIIGPVSLLSLLIIWLFRLHLPLVMLLVYGLYPLQIALMVPFGILGQAILPPAEVSNAVFQTVFLGFLNWETGHLPLYWAGY